MEHSLFNSIDKMKRFFGIIFIFTAVLCLTSCGGGKSDNSFSHPFAGKFSIDNGISFELNDDSTAVIHFDNGTDYESSWKIMKDGNGEYANIEFNGDQSYYYLKNGKIYRSHMEMDHDRIGSKVTYQD